MTDGPFPLPGEGHGQETLCLNVLAWTLINGRLTLFTHSNGLRSASPCFFPQALIIKQPIFWIKIHEMNTSKEFPDARMFLFRGGSRGLDSPAPDDRREELGIRPCSVEYHEAMCLRTMRCPMGFSESPTHWADLR